MGYAAKLGSSGGSNLVSVTVDYCSGYANNGIFIRNGYLDQDIADTFKYIYIHNGTGQYCNSWYGPDKHSYYNVSVAVWNLIAPIWNHIKNSGYNHAYWGCWNGTGTYNTTHAYTTYSIKPDFV